MDDNKSCSSKLSVCNLGLALGVVSGVGAFLLGLLSTLGFGMSFVHVTGSLYIGYEPGIIGAFIGLLWGFVHGYVIGALIALVYNYGRCCCPCKSCKDARCCAPKQ